jgi:hypothetical protein
MAFKVEATASGEAAAFGFVGGRNVAAGNLGADAESWVEGVEVARVEGKAVTRPNMSSAVPLFPP